MLYKLLYLIFVLLAVYLLYITKFLLFVSVQPLHASELFVVYVANCLGNWMEFYIIMIYVAVSLSSVLLTTVELEKVITRATRLSNVPHK